MPASMRIRLADPDRDATQVSGIYGAAVEGSVASFEEIAPGADEMAERIRGTLLRTPWLVAEDEGAAVVGYAYAAVHRERAGYRWSVDVSAYVRVDRRGRGVGRTLYDALFPMLKRQGFVNAYAGIALPNPPSVALHEALGMSCIGVYERVGYKFGAWHDVAWYGMRLSEPALPPDEPTRLSELASRRVRLDRN